MSEERAGAAYHEAALGHARLATTEVYLPLVVHDLREAMGGRKYRFADEDAGRRGRKR